MELRSGLPVHGPSDTLDLKLVSHPGRSIIIIYCLENSLSDKNNGLENVNHGKVDEIHWFHKRVNRILEVK